MADSTTSPYRELQPHLPPRWSIGTSGLCSVPGNSAEYLTVMEGFSRQAQRITRHQNIHQYGMFLVRQQQLHISESSASYVKVTRYCTLKEASSVKAALRFNLDPRRVSEPIVCTVSPPNEVAPDGVVLVVSFITRESNFGIGNIQPERDSDVYIEYVVYFADAL